MYKHLFLLFLLSGLAIKSQAQSADDRAKILQQCLDVTELQQHFPRDGQSRIKPLFILQHGVSFDQNINVTKGGSHPQFVSKAERVDKGIEHYFLFHHINIAQSSADVAFVYHTGTSAIIVNLLLQKAGNQWTVSERKIEKQ